MRVEADQIDQVRQEGRALPPFAGIPLSVKDLFDVRGEVTRAGSTILADDTAATSDALVVSRLKAAGFILIGRTNMTEFAFSGLGMNPHYGDPRSPLSVIRMAAGWQVAHHLAAPSQLVTVWHRQPSVQTQVAQPEPQQHFVELSTQTNLDPDAGRRGLSSLNLF